MTHVEMFETFWKAYPPTNGKKVGKAAARDRWNKDKCWKEYKQIMAAIEKQAKYDTGQRQAGKFQPEFPYAQKWLREKRWEDETGVMCKKTIDICDWAGCGNRATNINFSKGTQRCRDHPVYEFEVKK